MTYPLTVFVLDLARNGELQSRISRMGSLSVECSRYYAAQIVDALDYMHGKGVIHRLVGSHLPPPSHSAPEYSDLKPENLLLDDNFRLKITDFGTGKILDSDGRSPNLLHKIRSNYRNSTNREDLCRYCSVRSPGASRE